MSTARKNIFIIFFIFSATCVYAQDDYRVYHKLINNAERCYFLDNRNDSAYKYYDLAFSKFDFVFAKDCFMAAQIAFYSKNERYISYLKKGFKNGLRPQHLKYSKILMPLLRDSIAFNRKFGDYKELRKIYLKRINVSALKTVINHVSQDQSEKNMAYSANIYENTYEYNKKLQRHISVIESLIDRVGFPGDKIIGIDQADIMKELGQDSSDYMDLYNLIYKDPKYNTGRMQFAACDDCISQEKLFPLLLHHVCIYQLLHTKWEGLVISGQIHPRDVALLFDNTLRLYDDPADATNCKRISEIWGCDYVRPPGCYKSYVFVDYKKLNCDRRTTDSMRSALFINPLVVDSAKKAFADIHGFDVSFGPMYCR